MSAHRFEHLSVVKVLHACQPQWDGAEGVILGVTTDDEGTIFYAVHNQMMGTMMARESDLADTGRRMRREDIYDGSTIQVSRDGEVAGPDD